MTTDPARQSASPNAAASPERKEFRALRASGERAGPTKAIGLFFSRSRDRVARVLIGLGVVPNHVTIVGFLFTCGAAYCFARGASQQVPYWVWHAGPVGWWPIAAFILLVLAGACDMLDGAVARVGNLGTRAGGVLDSTVDRFSDMAIYIGCFLHFALLPRPNLTCQVMAVLGLCSGVLISYVKARAENLIDDCSVGYWLRGERFVGLLIACFWGHVPAFLWQMATTGFLTVWRRVSFAYWTLRALDTGRPLPPRGPSPGWIRIFQLNRHPRGSVRYDIGTGLQIAFLIFAPLPWPMFIGLGPNADPLRAWFGG